ncbi:unnamed protein product, partial [Amoebophrya sp. A25]
EPNLLKALEKVILQKKKLELEKTDETPFTTSRTPFTTYYIPDVPSLPSLQRVDIVGVIPGEVVPGKVGTSLHTYDVRLIFIAEDAINMVAGGGSSRTRSGERFTRAAYPGIEGGARYLPPDIRTHLLREDFPIQDKLKTLLKFEITTLLEDQRAEAELGGVQSPVGQKRKSFDEDPSSPGAPGGKKFKFRENKKNLENFINASPRTPRP